MLTAKVKFKYQKSNSWINFMKNEVNIQEL